MYFTFVDNGIALQVKSDCSQRSISNYRETPDWMIMVLGNDLGIKKSFKFCQNGNCCSTGVLSFAESREFVPSLVQISTGEQEKLRCKQNNYTEAYELGECGKFSFDLDSVENIVMTHITLHAVGNQIYLVTLRLSHIENHKIWTFNLIFYVKKRPNLSKKNSLKNIKLGPHFCKIHM